MLIRVVTTRADVPRTGEGIAFVHGEIQPQIAAMDGNAGFAMAVDRVVRALRQHRRMDRDRRRSRPAGMVRHV